MPFNYHRLRQQLLVHEGLGLRPYTDTLGHLTIGVGRNLTDVGITEDEALTLLDHDIAAVAVALDLACPWWKDLDDVRSRVLVDMTFNMGIRTVRGFTKFLSALRAGHYERAADQMLLSLWASQVHQRARTLAEMMRTGEDPQ